jgi:hypothetical protein
VDPACGLGAFLVPVLDVLTAERGRVAVALGQPVRPAAAARAVLRDNLYGVDLDPGSVQATRRALADRAGADPARWPVLRRAIRCGNALIDDPAVAGDRAFGWAAEFPAVLAGGGFDVVVGNPPYVSARAMRPADRRYLRAQYPELRGAYDLYVAFLLLGRRLVRDGGRYGWIVPNRFLAAGYAAAARRRLEAESLQAIVDVSGIPVFRRVGVYPVLLLGQPGHPAVPVRRQAATTPAGLADLAGAPAPPGAPAVVPAPRPARPASRRLASAAQRGLRISAGTTGFAARSVQGLLNEDGNGIPFAVSGSVDPYELDTSSVPYLNRRYRHPHVELGSPAVPSSKYQFWQSPKIVIAGMTRRVEAVYVARPLGLGVGAYAIHHCAGFEPYALTALLNSADMSAWLRERFHDTHLAGGYLAITKSALEQLPLPSPAAVARSGLTGLSKVLHERRPELSRCSGRLRDRLHEELGPAVWPRHPGPWWQLAPEHLGRRLPAGRRDRLRGVVAEHRDEAIALAAAVAAVERAVDQVVAQLLAPPGGPAAGVAAGPAAGLVTGLVTGGATPRRQ